MKCPECHISIEKLLVIVPKYDPSDTDSIRVECPECGHIFESQVERRW